MFAVADPGFPTGGTQVYIFCYFCQQTNEIQKLVLSNVLPHDLMLDVTMFTLLEVQKVLSFLKDQKILTGFYNRSLSENIFFNHT